MSRPVGTKRWGIRTLLFLGLAAGSIILSNWMRLTGNDDYILLPFLGMVTGLVGATVCTFRGLRAWGGRLPRE
jgi:Ni/Fe-hydrogenase subunit HybB-like protein